MPATTLYTVQNIGHLAEHDTYMQRYNRLMLTRPRASPYPSNAVPDLVLLPIPLMLYLEHTVHVQWVLVHIGDLEGDSLCACACACVCVCVCAQVFGERVVKGHEWDGRREAGIGRHM